MRVYSLRGPPSPHLLRMINICKYCCAQQSTEYLHLHVYNVNNRIAARMRPLDHAQNELYGGVPECRTLRANWASGERACSLFLRSLRPRLYRVGVCVCIARTAEKTSSFAERVFMHMIVREFHLSKDRQRDARSMYNIRDLRSQESTFVFQTEAREVHMYRSTISESTPSS